MIFDEKGQGAAEYVLLFGAVIVFAILALLIYYSYFQGQGFFSSSEDLNTVRENVSQNH
ncbi:MAG: class III signal peptide-containing protein [Methanobacteriales archaeon]